MLGRLFQERTVSYPWGNAATDGWGYWPGDPGYNSGGTNDPLHLVVVLGCVRLISDSISTLPVDVYRKSGDQKIPVAAPMWLTEPVPGELDFAAWCGQVLSSLLLNGNAYILIGRNDTFGIISLKVLDPALVTRAPDGRYMVNGRTGAEILHIKGLMLPGATEGLNPIAYARETIGLGSAALRYGAAFFEGDGNMPGVIEMQKVAVPDTKKQLAQQWRRLRSSGGKGLPGVLDDGATWKPTGVSNEDAQFLATRNLTDAQIAGQLFLVDPSDLGIGVPGTSLTYANLEQRNIRRVQVTLLPWMVRIEHAVSTLLAAPRYMKFNVDGLLRADLKSRYESYAIGIASKFLVPNEPRALEDLAPLPGGEAVVMPAQPIGGANAA